MTQMPPFYGLVQFVALIGAILGCVFGAFIVFGGLAAFKWGFMAGVAATGSGAVTILASLAGLGITYCFLAMVKAQIDTRNAVIAYLDRIGATGNATGNGAAV